MHTALRDSDPAVVMIHNPRHAFTRETSHPGMECQLVAVVVGDTQIHRNNVMRRCKLARSRTRCGWRSVFASGLPLAITSNTSLTQRPRAVKILEELKCGRAASNPAVIELRTALKESTNQTGTYGNEGRKDKASGVTVG